MLKSKKNYFIPIFGFALIMLIGSLMLYLPICNNKPITYWNALFTSVSSVTTTGISKTPIIEQFNFIGQIVLVVLMEVGALGFLIFVSYFWAITNKKMKISDILVINDSINSDNFALIKEYSVFIFKRMIKIQVLGVVLYLFKFIPLFGIRQGIWFSIFHSVSAFANAGFDLLGNNSYINYNNDIYLQLVTILIMFLGSIGILTIHDISSNRGKKFKHLKAQTKIVLIASFIMVIVPTVLLKIFQPNMSLTNCLFMSVTARSTGATIIDIQDLNIVSIIILTITMFIGGAPASTAGGVKIVSIVIIFATISATLRGENETILFWRKVPDITVKRAFTIFMIFILVLLISSCTFYVLNDVNLLDIVFDNVSAISNTGLSMIDYNNVNISGEIIILFLMFIGRVGPLSMVLMFVRNNHKDQYIKYPEENIIL